MMIFIQLLSIVLSSAFLVIGYSTEYVSGIPNWIAILGIAWILAVWGRWRWFHSAGLFVTLLVSMLGLWLGLSIAWMFSGAIFALVAWDMEEFRKKLNIMPARDDIKGMERRHLLRICLLVVLGLLIGWGLNVWVDS